MKWNGRYSPFEPEKADNDPDRDFPIREKVQDFAGKQREFEITYHDVGLGYTVQAEELGKEGLGYVLAALRDKISTALSTRHLKKEGGYYSPSHGTVKGRLTSRDGDLCFVVDGIPLSLEQFGKMAIMYEGWEFEMRIFDRCE